MDDEQLWKRRFMLFTLVRLTGVTVFLLGIAIAFSDLVRQGGWPEVGGILAVLGALDAVFAPRVLKKYWAQEDEAAGRSSGGR